MLILFVFLILLTNSTLFGQNGSDVNFLNHHLSGMDKNYDRLSSGILLWTDSPSSRAIYEKLNSHVIFLSTNIRNNNDLMSFATSKEGYLETIGNSLQRIRELILKRSNGFFNSDDRSIIDSEILIHYGGILKELSWAQFNTIPMFSSWLEDEDLKDRFKEVNFYTIKGIDRILQAVISERSRLGAVVNTLKYKNRGLAVEHENTNAFMSLGDTDFASELSNLKRNEILFYSNLFLLKFQK